MLCSGIRVSLLKVFRYFFLLWILLPTWGYSAHITDKLLAGMYAQPNSLNEPTQLLSSGTPLELISEKNGFVKVQLVDGQEGWVEKRFLSADKPAKVRLLELQSKYRQLQEKLHSAEQALASMSQASKPVSTIQPEAGQRLESVALELASARDKIQQLEGLLNQRDALVPAKQSNNNEKSSGLLVWTAKLMVLVFALLGALLIGMRVEAARQLKRHGGFRL